MDVRLPSGQVIRGVPEGTSKEVIMQKAIAGGLATAEDFGQPDKPAPESLTAEEFTARSGDIPDIYGEIIPQEAAPEPTLGEQVIGGAEAALTAATGATGGTLGLLGGTLQGIITELRSGEFGTNEAANRIADRAEAAMADLTYAPRTETGQEYVEAIGEAGAALAPLAGLGGAAQQIGQLGKAARPQVAQAAKTATQATKEAVEQGAELAKPLAEKAESIFKYQSPAKRKIGLMLEAGSTDAEIAKFKLGEKKPGMAPQVIKDKIATESIKQGFDEGVVASIKSASKADKAEMTKMVNIMKKGKTDAEYKAFNRPSDIVGDTLLSRVKVIRNANKQAGRDIGKESKKLKGQAIDISDAATNFGKTLDDLGVRLVDDGKGGFKPDFEISQLSPGDRGPIREVIRLMNVKGEGGIDGLTAHEMKKIIDNNVTFGKVKTGISGDAEKALKSFRSDINKSLKSTFPAYGKANKIYSETIDALDSLQSSIGQKLDLSGGHADKALGTKLRGLLSNNQNRINLLDSVEEIESIAKKHGAGGKLLIEGPEGSSLGGNSLMKQILFADELDRVFGPVARTSLAGEVGKVVEGAGRVAASPTGLGDLLIKGVAKGAEKVRGINEAGAFRAIKDLLKESP